MDLNMLRSIRRSQHKDARYMGNLIGKSRSAYTRKENGTGTFTPEEMSTISVDLGFTPEQTAYIFLDTGLRISNIFIE